MEYIHEPIWFNSTRNGQSYASEYTKGRPPYKRGFTAPHGHEHCLHPDGYANVNIPPSIHKRQCRWFGPPTVWTRTTNLGGHLAHTEYTQYLPPDWFLNRFGAYVLQQPNPEMSRTAFPLGFHYNAPPDHHSESATTDASKLRQPNGLPQEHNSPGVNSLTDEELETESFTDNFSPGGPESFVPKPIFQTSSQRSHRTHGPSHTSSNRPPPTNSSPRSRRRKSWSLPPGAPAYLAGNRQSPGTPRRSIDGFFKLFGRHRRISQGRSTPAAYGHEPGSAGSPHHSFKKKGEYPPPYQMLAPNASSGTPAAYDGFPAVPGQACNCCGKQRQPAPAQAKEAIGADTVTEEQVLHGRWEELRRAEAQLKEDQAVLRLEREKLQIELDNLRRQKYNVDEELRMLRHEKRRWNREKDRENMFWFRQQRSTQHTHSWSHAFDEFEFLFAGLRESDDEFPWPSDQSPGSSFESAGVGARTFPRARPAPSFHSSRKDTAVPSFIEARRQFEEYNRCWARLNHRDPAIPYPTANRCADELMDRSRLHTSLDHSAWTDAFVMETNTGLFFLRASGFRPHYVADGTGKVRLEARGGSPGNLESLKRHLRKERTRWHPDKLAGRNGGEPGRNTALAEDPRAKAVLQGINNLLELCDEKLNQRTAPPFL